MSKELLLRNASLASLACASMFLPLKTTLSNLSIITLLVLTLVSFIYYGFSNRVPKFPLLLFITSLALYFPIMLGTLYTPSPAIAFFQWGKCVFYLLCPLIILRKDLQRDEVWIWVTGGLILGSLLGALYLHILNVNSFLNSGLPLHRLFSYDYTGKSFTAPLGDMHPVYLGSYLLFMLLLLWRKVYFLNKYLKVIITLVAIVTVVFLNSRIIFLTGAVVLILSLFVYWPVKRTLLAIGMIAALLVILSLLFRNTYLYNKVVHGSQWELSEQIGQPNTNAGIMADSRMSRWLLSLEIISERPLLGYGTGTARGLLAAEYKKKHMTASLDQGYDSHNQYLAHAINYGVIGIIFLLGFFGSNIFKGYIQGNYLRIFYFLIIAGLCLTENYLIRNMGINFVALYSSLFNLPDHD